MASAPISKKRSLTWRHALLGTISVVAMAATFSAVGPTKAKANFNCANAGGSNNFNILLPPGQNGRNNGDTVQVCFGNVMLGEDNGNLDGTGGQLDIGLHVGNIYAGLANGSANGNIFFSQIPNSSSISLQVGNLLLGIANGSGNGNIVFGNNPNPYGDDANTVSATTLCFLIRS